MIIHFSNRIARRAFTLVEIMITGTLTTMVLGGVIYAHIVGIRMFQFTESKLGGNDDARDALSRLTEEVRSAKIVRVGNGDAGTFAECSAGALQQGNALQIYPTRNGSNYIQYFLASDDALRRKTSDSNALSTIARYVTNRIVFTSENFAGATLTNNENNRVIGLNLQFYQLQFGGVQVGTNRFYDYYQVRTRITRRALE
jgi:Tfp pilus assembly protein PilW